MVIAAWICLLLPLASAVAITLAGPLLSRRGAGYLATMTTFGAFVAAVVDFLKLHDLHASGRSHVTTSWTWLSAGPYHFGLSLLVDPLSVLMMLIVAGVGGLIVAYSVGYMDGEDEERRYFAYMSLFVFSMLLLVQGGNLLLLLAGWGMVGLSSYLLIGFYQFKESAVQAAKKAFIMNAFGDATMALALFLLIQHTGRLDYAGAFAASPHGGAVANMIALGLLGGAVAKSAQIPLQTWLPDAMEGPTPVSALIHAATMVTAGVYLIARTSPIFEQARTIELLAAGTGALTLLVAGLIALVQTDIKRVIAYSTMSQIGYMFVGVGVGGYANGMFHLMTHAFFKALLFMTAGLAIHALSGEQDIRKMRGLGRVMPFTKWCFLAGALALVGIPPFAGFFSKDPIIASTLNIGWYGYVFYACGIAGAFLTGLYTFRLWFLVFPGEPSPFVREHYHDHHGREGAWTMLVPVGILAVLATIGGWIQFPPHWDPITKWLAPVAPSIPNTVASSTQETVTSIVTVLVGLAGIGVAWAVYSERKIAIPAVPSVRRVLENKFYFDWLYDRILYAPAALVANALLREFEEPVVLQTGTDVGETTLATGSLVRRIQTGLLRTYVLFLAAGAAAVVLAFLIAR